MAASSTVRTYRPCCAASRAIAASSRPSPRDPVGLRVQIVRFFRDPRLHVVRIRATTPAGAVIGDVGGPKVLAPASRVVRRHGAAIGRVTLSVQDDAGYVKLVRRFTGATVQLGTPRADFHVQAFPRGALNVALLD